MTTYSHKSKQYGLIALKVLVLSATFGYIYSKLTSGIALKLDDFLQSLKDEAGFRWFFLLLFLGLAATNWCLEILKWKTVVAFVSKLSFATAAKQSLAALTVSLATPNRVGEYGAKAYFFSTDKRKQILLLNLFSNMAQMAITTLFGCIGLLLISQSYDLPFSTPKILLVVLALVLIIIFAYVMRKKELLIKGFSISNVVRYFQNLPANLKRNTLILALFRYLVFGSMFYLVLSFFGAEIGIQESIPLITSMYLLSSIIPTLFIFDVVIKGGVALWLFSLIGVPELVILSTVLTMWLFNFLTPALLGSYFVINYKPQ
jgi:uncharacterized membrane protein YbhN (UPF0104 family)